FVGLDRHAAPAAAIEHDRPGLGDDHAVLLPDVFVAQLEAPAGRRGGQIFRRGPVAAGRRARGPGWYRRWYICWYNRPVRHVGHPVWGVPAAKKPRKSGILAGGGSAGIGGEGGTSS